MAKNKYKAKPRATATGQSSSTGQAPPRKGDGECHVNVPNASDMKLANAVAEPVAVPVIQSPPAETWSDALPDNSSYATAESDESPATPPADSTGGALTDDILTEPAVPEASSAASEPPAAPVPGPDLVEVPAAPTVQASQDLAPAPAPAPPAAAGNPMVASAAPVAEPKAHSAGPAAAAPLDEPAAPAGLVVTCASCMDWLLRVYTYPVYLTMGAAVGLVTGMRDQLPGHSKVQHH